GGLPTGPDAGVGPPRARRGPGRTARSGCPADTPDRRRRDGPAQWPTPLRTRGHHPPAGAHGPNTPRPPVRAATRGPARITEAGRDRETPHHGAIVPDVCFCGTRGLDAGIRILASPPQAPRAKRDLRNNDRNAAPRIARQDSHPQRTPLTADPHHVLTPFQQGLAIPSAHTTRTGSGPDPATTRDQSDRLPGSPQSGPRRAHQRVSDHSMIEYAYP